MKNAFKPGAHQYRGKNNSRAKRLASKIARRIKPVPSKVWDEVEDLEKKPPLFSRKYLMGLADRLRAEPARRKS
jgi:hypothetical protein